MFIIEPNDFDAFSELFLNIQDEIDIIQNLIFVNDDDLWSQSNKDFIKRSDPDIILNMSNLDDEKLSSHFDIFSVKPITDQFKISRFGTTLNSFTRRPEFLEKFGVSKTKKISVLSALKWENTDEALFSCLNFGVFPKELKDMLALSIFKNLKVGFVIKKDEVIKALFKNDSKFIHLTTEIGSFGGSGYGSNIYELDYNGEGLFHNEKRYFFVSEKNDLKAISYFWNTRSYYTSEELAWVPIEIVNDLKDIVNKDSFFVCFNTLVESKIRALYPETNIIRPNRLHFRGRNERWTFLEYRQTISISDNEANVQHPASKSFSDIGSGGAFVLETRGLKEFLYPKKRSLGNLFFQKEYDRGLFAERFQRISELGLSTYVMEFSPLRVHDIFESIRLPSFNEVIEHIFEEAKFTIKKTTKSSILDQTINLLGGVGELGTIADKNLFELIRSLTPNVRTEKVINKILKDMSQSASASDILDIIADAKDKGGVSFPSVTLTIEEILNKVTLSPNQKEAILPSLQKLHDRRVLLRGKHFQCPNCSSNLWIQINEINRVNYCIECSNLIQIPIHNLEKQATDHYRLNQLVVRAVDQGQLATMLFINLLATQNYRAFDFISNLEIFSERNLLTDIDLVIRLGRKIGVAECKSNTGFDQTQIDSLVEIAYALKCDFVAFSCLLERGSSELITLETHLKAKSLNIPAFIFTKESLFKPHPQMIQKHFELRWSNDFIIGPIFVS